MLKKGVLLDWRFGPLEALRRWPSNRKVVLLHSGRFHPQWARWSIIAEPVASYRFTCDQSHWVAPGAQRPPITFAHDPLRDIRTLLQVKGGLWVGYLSYDLGRWVEHLAAQTVDDRSWPIVELGWCPGYLVYDRQTTQWQACGRWAHGGFPQLSIAEAIIGTFTTTEPRSNFTRADYESSIASILAYIAAGDVFQVNLAQRFTAHFDGPVPHATRALFDRLATVSPAWYGAYLETMDEPSTGHTGRVIASTSPELFQQVDIAGRVITRPIKGTRPASADPEDLRNSEKDRAELNMIVDLLRNDLGRVCAYGSVQVLQPRLIESHPTVHHGVATITGQMHPSKDQVDLLRATMPGGSVTGAPKFRAMQIIEKLEPVRRGPYCGCIGFISLQAMCLNIAIRTMLIDTDHSTLDYSVGGGIVADSDPQLEYNETIDKAAAILAALQQQRNHSQKLTEKHLAMGGNS